MLKISRSSPAVFPTERVRTVPLPTVARAQSTMRYRQIQRTNEDRKGSLLLARLVRLISCSASATCCCNEHRNQHEQQRNGTRHPRHADPPNHGKR